MFSPDLNALRRARTPSQSYVDCAGTIWSLHDETFNIWSHLVAACLFGFAALRFSICRTTSMNKEGYAVLLYLLGASLCFSLSALYHTFTNHRDAGFWQRMDHFGIATFIWVSSLTFSTLCFADHVAIQHLYTALSTILALFAYAQLRQEVTHLTDISWTRVSTHAIYGVLASLPSLHCVFKSTCMTSKKQQDLLGSFWAFVVLNGVGGTIYATESLERIISADHALLGTSHHVMHVFAVAGAWLFKRGIHTFHAGTPTMNLARTAEAKSGGRK